MADEAIERTQKAQELIQKALNNALYDKMRAEQKKYREWLLEQPPRVILDGSYQYHIREDLIATMDATDLDSVQAATLLDCDYPLEVAAKSFLEEGAYLDCCVDALVNAARQVQQEESQREEIPPQQRIRYGLEEQINDCYEYLGLSHKDAREMSGAELEEAETFLEKEFTWVSDPRYVQQIPRHIGTGELVPDVLGRPQETENEEYRGLDQENGQGPISM